MANPWPEWLTPERTAMRETLSSRVVVGRCGVCRRRKRCRYSVVNDKLYCSEECWDSRPQDSAQEIYDPFKMTRTNRG